MARSRVTLSCNWAVVLAANLAGALPLVLAMWQAGPLSGETGARAAAIAEAKLALGWDEAFRRGVLCNALVCPAVRLTMAARTVGGQILAILRSISAYVALGHEHSVAGSHPIPASLLTGEEGGIAEALGNFGPVTLGNVPGGAGGVALNHRLAYARPTT